jgi:hypothetical protein
LDDTLPNPNIEGEQSIYSTCTYRLKSDIKLITDEIEIKYTTKDEIYVSATLPNGTEVTLTPKIRRNLQTSDGEDDVIVSTYEVEGATEINIAVRSTEYQPESKFNFTLKNWTIQEDKSDEGSNSLPIILGSVLGGFALILIGVIVTVFCIMVRSKKKRLNNQRQQDYAESE